MNKNTGPSQPPLRGGLSPSFGGVGEAITIQI